MHCHRKHNPILVSGLMLLSWIALCGTGVTAIHAQTAEGSSSTTSDSMATPGGGLAAGGPVLSIVKVVGGLGLILGLIIFGFLGARRFAPQYFGRHSGGKSLEVIETLQMGEKRSIALVRVCGKRMLLGNGTQQITLLAQLDEGTAPVLASEPASPKPTALPKNTPISFRKLLEFEQHKQAEVPEKVRFLAPDVRAKMRQLREALEK